MLNIVSLSAVNERLMQRIAGETSNFMLTQAHAFAITLMYPAHSSQLWHLLASISPFSPLSPKRKRMRKAFLSP